MGAALDHDTSEVVEAMTYQLYGGVEADYRPRQWQGFREDVRYTGHWDDSQVGLVYFGARYYAPQLARWISPDPLTVHGFAGDPNPYAFVGGSPMTHVDPFGLDDPFGGTLPPGGTGAQPPPPPPPEPTPNTNTSSKSSSDDQAAGSGPPSAPKAPTQPTPRGPAAASEQAGVSAAQGNDEAGSDLAARRAAATEQGRNDANLGQSGTSGGGSPGGGGPPSSAPTVISASVWPNGGEQDVKQIVSQITFVLSFVLQPATPAEPSQSWTPSAPAKQGALPTTLVPYYPGNNGFLRPPSPSVLQPGTLVDRYGGSPLSRFFSPAGTPLPLRAAPPGTAGAPLRTFRVLQPWTVDVGEATPAFGQLGTGIQYRSSAVLGELIESGILEELVP